jgi:hypothetical protein
MIQPMQLNMQVEQQMTLQKLHQNKEMPQEKLIDG